MSLMTLRKKMSSRRTTQIILWALVVVFIAGIGLTTSGMRGTSQQQYRGGVDVNSKDVAVTVNGQAIELGPINREYAKQIEQGRTNPDIDTAPSMREGVLFAQIEKQLRKQAAKEMRVSVNYFGLRNDAKEYARVQVADIIEKATKAFEEEEANAKTPEEKKKLSPLPKRIADEYKSFIQQNGGTIDEKKAVDEKAFTNWYINEFLLKKAEPGIYELFADHVLTSRIGEKYLEKEFTVSPFTPAYAEMLSTKEVKARWIFVQVDKNTPEAMKEARDEAEKVQKAVAAKPSTFANEAKKVSDDMMTAGASGDLGWVSLGQGMTQTIAEYLAFTTEKGKVSAVVPAMTRSYFSGNKFGFAIVMVEDVRKREKPDEAWQKNRDVAMLKIKQRYAPDFGNQYLQLLQTTADIKPVSQEFAVYLHDRNGEFIKSDEARAKAVKDPNVPEQVRGAFAYKLGMGSSDLNLRAEMLQMALPYASTAKLADMHIELGRTFASLGKKDAAIEQFGYAASNGQPTDRTLRETLRGEYKKLGDAEGVAAMDKWLKENPATPQTDAPGMSFGGGM